MADDCIDRDQHDAGGEFPHKNGYDGKTLTTLLNICETRIADSNGSLITLHDRATDHQDLETRLIRFYGLGPLNPGAMPTGSQRQVGLLPFFAVSTANSPTDRLVRYFPESLNPYFGPTTFSPASFRLCLFREMAAKHAGAAVPLTGPNSPQWVDGTRGSLTASG